MMAKKKERRKERKKGTEQFLVGAKKAGGRGQGFPGTRTWLAAKATPGQASRRGEATQAKQGFEARVPNDREVQVSTPSNTHTTTYARSAELHAGVAHRGPHDSQRCHCHGSWQLCPEGQRAQQQRTPSGASHLCRERLTEPSKIGMTTLDRMTGRSATWSTACRSRISVIKRSMGVETVFSVSTMVSSSSDRMFTKAGLYSRMPACQRRNRELGPLELRSLSLLVNQRPHRLCEVADDGRHRSAGRLSGPDG